MFLLIIGAVFIFVLGGGAGVLYQTQKDAPQVNKADAVLKIFSLKSINAINIVGEASKINEKSIILDSKGIETEIVINNNTIIYNPTLPKINLTETDVLKQQKVKLSDIKQKDILSVAVAITPEGLILAKMIVVMPYQNNSNSTNNVNQ